MQGHYESQTMVTMSPHFRRSPAILPGNPYLISSWGSLSEILQTQFQTLRSPLLLVYVEFHFLVFLHLVLVVNVEVLAVNYRLRSFLHFLEVCLDKQLI